MFASGPRIDRSRRRPLAGGCIDECTRRIRRTIDTVRARAPENHVSTGPGELVDRGQDELLVASPSSRPGHMHRGLARSDDAHGTARTCCATQGSRRKCGARVSCLAR